MTFQVQQGWFVRELMAALRRYEPAVATFLKKGVRNQLAVPDDRGAFQPEVVTLVTP